MIKHIYITDMGAREIDKSNAVSALKEIDRQKRLGFQHEATSYSIGPNGKAVSERMDITGYVRLMAGEAL